jgi:hypothetical protein
MAIAKHGADDLGDRFEFCLFFVAAVHPYAITPEEAVSAFFILAGV